MYVCMHIGQHTYFITDGVRNEKHLKFFGVEYVSTKIVMFYDVSSPISSPMSEKPH